MLTRPGMNATRQRVHDRIRKKMLGTSERPRLNVYRSLNHIYVQVIDDLKGQTLVSASSAEGKKGELRSGGNVAAAKAIGKAIAERAKAKRSEEHTSELQSREKIVCRLLLEKKKKKKKKP